MPPLLPDTSYHIFNHANGFENIFRHEANYYFFLEKYRKYIGPVAETYAWCLMPNHFHMVIRIRKRPVLVRNFSNFSKVRCVDQGIAGNQEITDNINFNNFSKVRCVDQGIAGNQGITDNINGANFGKVINISDSEIGKYLSKQFANLFSCYTQSFNKVYGRMGSLFIKNFKREPILSKAQFLNTIVYTHRNPIHHGFCKQYDEWPYSSYLDVINGNNDGLEIDKLLRITGGLEGLDEIHRRSLEKIDTSNYPDIPLIL